MDAVGTLAREAPEHVQVKLLAGQIVWLREDEQEWVGPAEEALARLRTLEPAAAFWSAFK